LLVAILIWTQRRSWLQLAGDWNKNRLAYLFITPSILVIVLTIVYPFCYNIVLSFSNMSLRNFQDWQIVGWQNYEQIFRGQDSKFLMVLVKTVIWTVVCVFFHVAIGLLLAVALNGPIRGKPIYRILLILPWAIPAYITALTWRGMFDYEYGAINAIASQLLGLAPINWLGDEINALVACIVTNIWLGFPFMMVIALGGMQGIPREMYEAAQIDRVSRWGQFWHITLPMLKPVLIPAVTLGTIWTFNNLNVVWLVSNSGEPSDKTHILVSYVYKAVFNLYQYGYGAALSIVIFVMLLIFSLVFLSRSRATEGV
jgi:arabinogalactan oligomer / maltooligosaccharide transport system permease protein